MKILLLNQYYPPDIPPTGRVLHDLAGFLVREGHQVRVFCSKSSYGGGRKFDSSEILDGVEIQRVPACGFGRRTYAGKLLDYASFCVSLSVRLIFMRWRPDLVFCMTTPPYLGVLGKFAALFRRCVYAHWIMDLYPDALYARRSAQEDTDSQDHGKCLSRILRALKKFELKGSRAVIAIGPDMAELAGRYTGGDVPWVPLWSGSNPVSPCDGCENDFRRELNAGEKLVLMYSGNMGMAHRFDEFIEAVSLTKNDETLMWVFAGGGRRLVEIEKFCAGYDGGNIRILPYAPADRLPEHLCSADVHLASMDESWKGCVVPSKLQGSFGVGRPVIFMGPSDSSIGRWIDESGGGWVVPNNDVPALLHAIDQARYAS